MNTDDNIQQFESYESMPQQASGEVSAEQAQIAQEWTDAMQEINDNDPSSPQNIRNNWENAFNDYGDFQDGAAFAGFSPEQPDYQPQETNPDYTEMPGLDLGNSTGALAEFMSDDNSTNENETQAYATAFDGDNPIATMAAQKAVSGASGISTENVIQSLEGNGISKGDISNTIDRHSVEHFDAMQAAYSDNEGDERQDQRDATAITTAITELSVQAQAEAGLAAAAVANESADADLHKAKVNEAAEKTQKLADAAKFANKFVDNADLNRRFNESITAATQDAIEAQQSANSLTAENATAVAEELGVDEAEQQELASEDTNAADGGAAETSTENNTAEEASEAAVPEIETSETLTPAQLNPEILGDASYAIDTTEAEPSQAENLNPDNATEAAPTAEQIGKNTPDNSPQSDTAIAEAALRSTNPLNAELNQLNTAGNINLEQFNQPTPSATPSADTIRRSIDIKTDY